MALCLMPAISKSLLWDTCTEGHLSAKLCGMAPLWTCLLDNHCSSPYWLAGGK